MNWTTALVVFESNSILMTGAFFPFIPGSSKGSKDSDGVR